MNEELIKRIDCIVNYGVGHSFPARANAERLIFDLHTEIQRLLTANKALKGLCEEYQAQIKAQGDEVGCDEVARPAPSFDAQREDLLISYIDECIMLRAALVRAQGEYVPMTIHDRENIRQDWLKNNYGTLEVIALTEAEVIKRAGLVVKGKE